MNNTGNINSTNNQAIVSGPDDAPLARVSAMIGPFRGFVVRQSCGVRNSTVASNHAPDTMRPGNISQRLCAAPANSDSSVDQRLKQLRLNMVELYKLVSRLIPISTKVDNILKYSVVLADELSEIKNASPATIISELKSWNEELELGFDDNAIDSSQTITTELAEQALEQFKTRFGKLQFDKQTQETMKLVLYELPALMPAIRTSIEAFQKPNFISLVEDEFITFGKKVQFLISQGHPIMNNVLSVTSGNEDYQELKKDLDSCIQNILYMQGTKTAEITEVFE
ncbi:hypothetical protein [Endozoicomonas sp. ONNA2]|uniref:hypothetical protein n=1 Tax=Endozoicomonas sp. ONNA2 TaxID=2828741 RepID=UPI002149497B|nr:hypothetical protein [Endozoicomonas sp. ONNA2]